MHQIGVKSKWSRISKSKFQNSILRCRVFWKKWTMTSSCASKVQMFQIFCVNWTHLREIWVKWSWRREIFIGTRRLLIWVWWSHSTTLTMPKCFCLITLGYGLPFMSGMRTSRSGKCLLLKKSTSRRSSISHRSMQEQSYCASATCQREAQLYNISKRWCSTSKRPCRR